MRPDIGVARRRSAMLHQPPTGVTGLALLANGCAAEVYRDISDDRSGPASVAVMPGILLLPDAIDPGEQQRKTGSHGS
jgi:hypothetical protein